MIIRNCPFCGAAPGRLQINSKMARTATGDRRLTHYVRCNKCGARGPIAKGQLYDVRNTEPAMTAKKELAEDAIRRWNADRADDYEIATFKLEGDEQ